jgi:hypothetical protein
LHERTNLAPDSAINNETIAKVRLQTLQLEMSKAEPVLVANVPAMDVQDHRMGRVAFKNWRLACLDAA